MRAGFAAGSLVLLGLSVLFLVTFTMFESILVGIPSATERVLTFLLLVLPAAAGAILGVLSLVRREGRTALASLGIVSNTQFALFHLVLVLFAG